MTTTEGGWPQPAPASQEERNWALGSHIGCLAGAWIAMDPRGDTVYVTGVSAKSPPGVPGLVVYAPNADQLTIAYDVATGEKRLIKSNTSR